MSEKLGTTDIRAALGTDDFIFVEFGPNVWGKGFTRDQAHVAAGRPKHFVVYACRDPWAYIDGMGSIVYKPTNDPTTGAPVGLGTDYVVVDRKQPKATRPRAASKE